MKIRDFILLVLCLFLVIGCIELGGMRMEEIKVRRYILSDTEDQGDYIISITRASAKVSEYPRARFYFVEFIDADGDYEHLIVRVDKDGIHEFAVEE